MNDNDGMTTPVYFSSQNTTRYLSSNAPIRNFSLKEIEENNLEFLEEDQEPQLNETEVKEKLDKILNYQSLSDDKMNVEERDERINENEEDNNLEMENYEEDVENQQINGGASSQQANSNKKESHKKEKVGLSRFPISKIKNIMKLDEDVKLCQKNAYIVLGRLTELFLQEIAQNAHSVARLNKRKTMNLEDIACAVKSTEKYSFIDINSIFNIETIEDLKLKEEKLEKKIKQSETNLDKKEKKESKIDKINKKNNNIQSNNMKIDKMFFPRQERESDNN